MEIVAGVILIGVLLLMYIAYNLASYVFKALVVFMLFNAYIVTVDRLYPDISLLQLCRMPAAPPSPMNQTLPETIQRITQVVQDKVEEAANHVPSGWRQWWPMPLIFGKSTDEPSADPKPKKAPKSKKTPKPKSSEEL